MSKNQRDERLTFRDEPEGQERSMEEREVTQDREMTDEERLDALRLHSFAKPLPDIPHIQGHHGIWLTTTNPRDSIQTRLNMGYTFVTPQDVPQWHTMVLSPNAGFPGSSFSVNEMIAMKLPDRLWNLYMKEIHHDAPNREEEKLSAAMDVIREQAERMRARVDVEPGSAEIGKAPVRPNFEGQPR